jgi:putative hydrolase of HD superfamily
MTPGIPGTSGSPKASDPLMRQATSPDRIGQQIAFLAEADKLKLILRRTPLIDLSRRENSAEHSWHLILTAMIVREHVGADVDLMRVLEMLAIHDLIEIDAGDTFAYDFKGQATKAERERAGAERVFGILPDDQRAYLRQLWDEFEAQETIEARFAHSVDRLQPLIVNASCGGGSWINQNLTQEDILRRMAPIETALPTLWPFVTQTIDRYCAAGVLAKSPSRTRSRDDRH